MAEENPDEAEVLHGDSFVVQDGSVEYVVMNMLFNTFTQVGFEEGPAHNLAHQVGLPLISLVVYAGGDLARQVENTELELVVRRIAAERGFNLQNEGEEDRKSTRLNSSH